MTKVKRVRAQRKFAAGVWHRQTVERPRAVAPMRRAPPTVTSVRLQATTYLDLITFHNLHRHDPKFDVREDQEDKQPPSPPPENTKPTVLLKPLSTKEIKDIRTSDPVVMLKKIDLESVQKNKTNQKLLNGNTKNINTKNGNIKNVPYQHKSKVSVVVKKKLSKIFLPNKHNMRTTRLQSSASASSNTTDSNSSIKRFKLRKRGAAKLNTLQIKKKKIATPISSDLSSDDDTPLKKLCEEKEKLIDKKVNKLNTVEKSPEPTTRPIRKSSRTNAPKVFDIDTMNVLYDLSDMSDWNEPLIKETKKAETNSKPKETDKKSQYIVKRKDIVATKVENNLKTKDVPAIKMESNVKTKDIAPIKVEKDIKTKDISTTKVENVSSTAKKENMVKNKDIIKNIDSNIKTKDILKKGIKNTIKIDNKDIISKKIVKNENKTNNLLHKVESTLLKDSIKEVSVIVKAIVPPVVASLKPEEPPTFKVPLPVSASRFKRRSADRGVDRCPSPSCPSTYVQHNKSVEDNSSFSINSWHKMCKNCHVLDKIRDQMNTMVEKNTRDAEDVYNFSCDPESDNEALINYRHRRAQPEGHSIYLDYFEENSPFIIQIMNDKSMMSARILPRSQLNSKILKKASGDVLSNPGFLKEILSSLKGDENGIVLKREDVKKTEKSKKEAVSKKIEIAPQPIPDAIMAEAPVYRPTTQQFENPLAYIESIRTEAEKFGICKIIPPSEFKPSFNPIPDDVNFMTSNQYICKMYKRWGPATRELCAIKAHLATQNVVFKRPPLIDGMEVDLAKLYHKVQHMGGLKEVIERKKWGRVAEEMGYGKTSHIDTKLDKIYCKYLLPYDTLTTKERQDIMRDVDAEWSKRYEKMLFRAKNPLHRQKKMLDGGSSDEEEESAGSLREVEDCVLPGRHMNLRTFRNVARRCEECQFPSPPSTPGAVESAYWGLVRRAKDHVAVYSASVHTGDQAYGFPQNSEDEYSKHPWNLKVLSCEPGSALRWLGPVLGATVPALHLGMLFSTSCWHRDPHGLPWIEYLHQGPPKIWYGIPSGCSEQFRKAVSVLAPAYCQNKAIWLPSDIAMIPPSLLTSRGVSLCRTNQEAGEYILVFPKAYSSSICTGLTVSESVYFAPHSWLATVHQDFQEARDSCEPSMFSLCHLLVSAAADPRVPLAWRPHLLRTLTDLVKEERTHRHALIAMGLTMKVVKRPPKKKCFLYSWTAGEHTECDICRRTLFLSKVSGINGKKSDLCVEHAVRVLGRSSQLEELKSQVQITCFYTEEALQQLMAALKQNSL